MVANNSLCAYKTFYQGQWIANIRKTGLWFRVRRERKNNFLISLANIFIVGTQKNCPNGTALLTPKKLMLRQFYAQDLK